MSFIPVFVSPCLALYSPPHKRSLFFCFVSGFFPLASSSCHCVFCNGNLSVGLLVFLFFFLGGGVRNRIRPPGINHFRWPEMHSELSIDCLFNYSVKIVSLTILQWKLRSFSSLGGGGEKDCLGALSGPPEANKF